MEFIININYLYYNYMSNTLVVKIKFLMCIDNINVSQIIKLNYLMLKITFYYF